MKTMSKRSMIIYLLIFSFFAGVVYFLISLGKNASAWVMSPANNHIYSQGELASGGDILDRNGEVLATTVDGERIYHPDAQVRKAMLHTVGDSAGFIATGAQKVFKDRLIGYNYWNGVYNLMHPQDRHNLNLSLSANISTTALEALGNRHGTVGVLNYKTGEMLCMVSAPTYDPEKIPTIVNSDPAWDGVYLNRILSGLYVPGSTFKVITAATALENIPDIETQTFTCKGQIKMEGATVICNGVHGTQTFAEAFANSCNVAFAQIATELGETQLEAGAKKMGLNRKFNLDGIPAAMGNFDVTGASEGELGWAGIGQHTTLVNPYQMLVMVGSIANGGRTVQPTQFANPKKLSLSPGSAMISPQIASKMKELMRNNVKSEYGDSHYPELTLCAKSGTAEVEQGKTPTAWFVGFMDDASCPLAFVVILEEGGSGSRQAGPVANTVLQAAKKELTS